MFRRLNSAGKLNLFFAVICLSLFVLACSRQTSNNAWSIQLREAEHKTAKHPEKHYFASVWPDGLQISFKTAQGHFGSYTFPRDEFPPGEARYLSCPGSPELLPVRVVRINRANDYKVEWLTESPTESETNNKVVRSQ